MADPDVLTGPGVRAIACAGLLYFVLILLAGTLLGVARTLWLAPRETVASIDARMKADHA